MTRTLWPMTLEVQSLLHWRVQIHWFLGKMGLESDPAASHRCSKGRLQSKKSRRVEKEETKSGIHPQTKIGSENVSEKSFEKKQIGTTFLKFHSRLWTQNGLKNEQNRPEKMFSKELKSAYWRILEVACLEATSCFSVDGSFRNPAEKTQLRLVAQGFKNIPIFPCGWPWDFWTIKKYEFTIRKRLLSSMWGLLEVFGRYATTIVNDLNFITTKTNKIVYQFCFLLFSVSLFVVILVENLPCFLHHVSETLPPPPLKKTHGKSIAPYFPRLFPAVNPKPPTAQHQIRTSEPQYE